MKSTSTTTDFALISISSDANDETVAKFVEENKMPWIHIRETAGDGCQI